MIRLYRMLMRPYAAGLGAVLVLIFLQTIATLYLPTLMADIVNNGIARSADTVNGNAPQGRRSIFQPSKRSLARLQISSTSLTGS